MTKKMAVLMFVVLVTVALYIEVYPDLTKQKEVSPTPTPDRQLLVKGYWQEYANDHWSVTLKVSQSHSEITATIEARRLTSSEDKVVWIGTNPPASLVLKGDQIFFTLQKGLKVRVDLLTGEIFYLLDGGTPYPARAFPASSNPS